MLCKPRSHPFGMLQKLVGTVLDAGGLAAKKKRRERMISSVFNYNTKKKKKRTHLVRGKGFTGKVLSTGIETSLDKTRVESHKVLHLWNAVFISYAQVLWKKRGRRPTCFFSITLDMCACSAPLNCEKSMVVVLLFFGVGGNGREMIYACGGSGKEMMVYGRRWELCGKSRARVYT